MFDIGFSELLLFGIIALIVLGPEKLPQAARTAGQWYAKIRRTVSTLQSEIEAELDLAETRQQMQKELAKIRQTESDMKRELAEMRGNMKEFENAQNQQFNAAHDTVGKAAHGKADENNGEQNSSEQKSQSVTPKEFDYAYGQDTTLADTKQPLEADDSLHGPSKAGHPKIVLIKWFKTSQPNLGKTCGSVLVLMTKLAVYLCLPTYQIIKPMFY